MASMGSRARLQSERSGCDPEPGAYCVLFLGKTLKPLSTQVYKWVPENLKLGVTLRWTNIPSRGS